MSLLALTVVDHSPRCPQHALLFDERLEAGGRVAACNGLRRVVLLARTGDSCRRPLGRRPDLAPALQDR